MLPEENILFKGIEPDDCSRMISCFNADIKTFKSGSRIMDYSDNPDKLGIILSGTAVMVRYDINGVRSIMESLGEQSVFGVYFTFTASQRSGIEIIAENECEVLFVKRSEITKRCENACQCHSRVDLSDTDPLKNTRNFFRSADGGGYSYPDQADNQLYSPPSLFP